MREGSSKVTPTKCNSKIGVGLFLVINTLSLTNSQKLCEIGSADSSNLITRFLSLKQPKTDWFGRDGEKKITSISGIGRQSVVNGQRGECYIIETLQKN